MAAVRSAVTNGKLFRDVDERTAWVRRFRDLLYAHEADLGGDEILSEGQRSIVRRAAMLEVQLEMLEARFAANDGVASQKGLDQYQRATNTLRRTLESLGLNESRKAHLAAANGYDTATAEIVRTIEGRANRV
jgi:hypothetical protein